MKLNNKGMSIVEIVLTFALIMVMVIGMITIVFNYREKASISLEKLDMDTFKNTLTKDIQDDILEKGVQEINVGGECTTNTELHSCINIIFKDGSSKIFGTGIVNNNDRHSVENKFLYYDGLKYELKDSLPKVIPDGRKASDFQLIAIQDSNILSTDSTVLEDGTTTTIYSIDVYISHLDFDEDFGIHIVTSTDSVKSKAYTTTNLITNGSFESGLDNWSTGTLSTEKKYHGSYSLMISANKSVVPQQTIVLQVSPIYGHIYYGSTMFLSSSVFTVGDSRFEWWYNDEVGKGTLIFGRKSIQTTNWVRISSTATLTSSTYTNQKWLLRNFLINPSTDAYIDAMLLIDLTETFGSGNEPSKEWCDSHINYFDGTTTIYK